MRFIFLLFQNGVSSCRIKAPPSPCSPRWRGVSVWLMRSCREFPLAGGTRRSDLTTTLKPSQTEKERGRLTLANIDLLLPPILPGPLLSAFWLEITGHIHTRTLREKNQTSALTVFFITLVFPGDSNLCGHLTHAHCMLWPVCLFCFYGFCTSRFKCPHECLHRLIHLCLFLDWSPASGPDSTMCLPCLRGIPISAGFPGIPLCVLTLYFPFSLRTHTHTNRHTHMHT